MVSVVNRQTNSLLGDGPVSTDHGEYLDPGEQAHLLWVAPCSRQKILDFNGHMHYPIPVPHQP